MAVPVREQVRAGDVNRSAADVPAAHAPPHAALPAAEPSRAERARRTAYRGRFAVLYAVLAAIAGAAIATTVVLVGRGSPAPAPPWSEWQPVGSAERRLAQIADHVPRPYRLPSGNQLVSAVAGPPSAPAADGTLVQMRFILVHPHTARGESEASDVEVVDAGSTVMFILCGVGGRSCAIGEGTPTPERHALLRREALELALYSFKYLDDIGSVVVLLPPRPDQQTATAVFLERGDVGRELSRPVAETFTAPVVPDVGAIPAEELSTIDRITRPRLYSYQYDSAQDGSPMMILAPALG
jgi:hypothetical protein